MMRSLTEEDEAVLFHDISTRRGSIRRLLFRWKWVVVPLLVFSALLLFLGLIAETDDDTPSYDALVLQSPPVYPQLKFTKGNLEILGDSSKPTISVEKTTNLFQYFDSFPGIQHSLASSASKTGHGPKSIKSIKIKWYKINGPNLSLELSLFPNLEILHLDNVTIFNELQPTPLPKLKELYINQMVEPEQPDNFKFYDDGYSSYLSSAFLFLYDVQNGTDFDSKLVNTMMNISIWLSGSIVFSVDPAAREIRSDLSNCRPLLENSTVPYTKVTLGTCNDLLPTSISPKTRSLNLYLVSGITSDFLSLLWPNLPNLEEIFIEVVDFEVEINMGELPKSLKVFSASSIRITGDSELVLPNIREFYFGGENQYGWTEVRDAEISGNDFLNNLHKVFPSIDKVGIFELHHGRYTFLKSVLNSTARTIVAQGFQRLASRNDTNITSSFQDENEAVIEALLTELGLPITAEFFMIESKFGKLVARTLDWIEQIALRYKMLGWDGIDIWGKYVHVRRLLDGGFILG